MKKIIFSTLIASLLAFVGCQNEELVNENTNNGGEKVILTANIQGAADSRVALTPDTDNEGNPIVKVAWNESGETFEVYGSSGASSTFTQIAGTNQFVGTLPEPADGEYEYEAYYGNPNYLDEQDGKLGQSTANDLPVLMSAMFNSTSPSITFEHETAILKPTFKVNGTDINNTITKIVMGGVAKNNLGNGYYLDEITIPPTSPTTAMDDDIYIHLLVFPQVYIANHKFTFTVIAGVKNYTGSLTIPNGKSIEAGNLYTATIELEEEKDLEYIASSNTFNVKTAAGLQHLNEWMTGTKSTSDFKAIGFAGNQDITAAEGSDDALAMNITFMADITLDNPATTGGSNWTPIGTAANPYTGTIDGNGKTLGGMVINSGIGNIQGFVGYLGFYGQIKNLTFANAQVVTSKNNAGIVVGYNCGIVENCHTISNSSVNGYGFVGGIVGYNEGTITNCTNAAQVVATNTMSNVGGITGHNRNVVSFCINSGSVSGIEGVGGIVGYQRYDGAEVIACGNTGSVSVSSVSDSKRVGGIVGWNSDYSNAIASWTITTAEMDQSGQTPVTKDGVGQNFNATITACYSVANAADLNSEVSNMNTELLAYYNTNDPNNKYYWTSGTNGGWPTLTTTAPAPPAQGN